MCRLVETIRIENGIPMNIRFHIERMSRSLYHLFGIRNPDMIENFMVIPERALEGIWKYRVEYERTVVKTEFLPYVPKIIKSLRIVCDDSIEYQHKFTDRSDIEELFKNRGECDDILIIKKGMVTDTSYANVIFKDSGGRWVTPSTYLLPGTMRACLLDAGIICEEEICYEDIHNYVAVKPINAMLRMCDTEEIPVSGIMG